MGGLRLGPVFTESFTESVSSTQLVARATIMGHEILRGGSHGAGVQWLLEENPTQAEGIPALLRTAVLLEGPRDEAVRKISCLLQIQADISGFNLGQKRTESEFFLDPMTPSWGADILPPGSDSFRLGEIGLQSLMKIEFINPVDVGRTEELEREVIQKVEEILGRATTGHPLSVGDSFYVELWTDEYEDNGWTPRATKHPGMEGGRFVVPSKLLPDKLGEADFSQYFSWLMAAKVSTLPTLQYRRFGRGLF